MIEIRVSFKIRVKVRFWVRVRVKYKFRFIKVFRVRVQFPLSIQRRGTDCYFSVGIILTFLLNK